MYAEEVYLSFQSIIMMNNQQLRVFSEFVTLLIFFRQFSREFCLNNRCFHSSSTTELYLCPSMVLLSLLDDANQLLWAFESASHSNVYIVSDTAVHSCVYACNSLFFSIFQADTM